MKTALLSIRHWSLAIPLTVCVILNLVILLTVQESHPSYFEDYRLNPNVDAPDYVRLGWNVYLLGEYTRSTNPPYAPELFRTPGYPIFAGGLDLLGGAILIYVVQCLIHFGLCAVVHSLARRTSGIRPAFVAALLTAVHPTLLVLNVQAMSEILFLFLMLSATLFLTISVQEPETRPRRALAAGVLLGTAILVRPAGLYLPVIWAIILAVMVFRSVGWGAAMRRSGLLLLGAALCLGPWMVRNYAIFGTSRLTTNDTIVLVYFTGAGAYQVEHGVDLSTAWEMIAREQNLHSPEDMWNYYDRGLSPVEMDREASRAVIPVLTRYPVALVKACSLGFVKAMFSHDAGWLSRILNVTWTKPGTQGLLQFEQGAWDRLRSNHPLAIAVFFTQVLLNAALLVLVPSGILIAFRRRLSGTYPALVTLVFFSVVCAASGLETYTRFTAPLLPFAFLFAGVSVTRMVWGRTPVSLRIP
jgi:4-amino-4-deoxy-L-arabinose transferase-like glycosyltransferase